MYVFLKLTPLSAARARHIRLTCLRRCSPSACTWLRTVELGPWTLAKIIKETNVRRVDRRNISTERKFNQFLHHEIRYSWTSHESWVPEVGRTDVESASRRSAIPLDRRRSWSVLLQITQWYFWYLCLLTLCENTCHTINLSTERFLPCPEFEYRYFTSINHCSGYVCSSCPTYDW